jgi:hypothetical protein
MDRPHVNPDDPIPGPEVGFEEIAIDFLEARFWITPYRRQAESHI